MDGISPVDGRYSSKLDALRIDYGFTERQLILTKAEVELKWLERLAETQNQRCALALLRSAAFRNQLRTPEFVDAVKAHEARTNHDTKSVELAIRDLLLAKSELQPISEMTHHGLTSEDVTGTAYALMFVRTWNNVLRPKQREVVNHIRQLATATANSPVMCLTHGQPATPSTFGKELCVFLNRLGTCSFTKFPLSYKPTIKFGGATGTFGSLNACIKDKAAVLQLVQEFVTTLSDDFELDLCTTQIANREWMIECLQAMERQNLVLLDLARDMWLYISRDILSLKVVQQEVGSSTMPHKVNPIHFENAEGNLIVANGHVRMLTDKLLISRLQRDLSDSTVIRNLGMPFAHTLLALDSLSAAFARVRFNGERAAAELMAHPELLAEPIQSVLRQYPEQIADPYSILKHITRRAEAQTASPFELLQEQIPNLREILSAEDYEFLAKLTPASYVGLAPELAAAVLLRYF